MIDDELSEFIDIGNVITMQPKNYSPNSQINILRDMVGTSFSISSWIKYGYDVFAGSKAIAHHHYLTGMLDIAKILISGPCAVAIGELWGINGKSSGDAGAYMGGLEDLNGHPISLKFKVEESFIDHKIISGIAEKISGNNWGSYNSNQQQEIISSVEKVFEMLPQYSQLNMNELYNNNTIDLSCFPYSVFKQLNYFKDVDVKTPAICQNENETVHSISMISDFEAQVVGYQDRLDDPWFMNLGFPFLTSSPESQLNIAISHYNGRNLHSAVVKLLSQPLLIASSGKVYESYVGSNCTLLHDIKSNKYYFVNSIDSDGNYLNVSLTLDVSNDAATSYDKMSFVNNKDNSNEIGITLYKTAGGEMTTEWYLSGVSDETLFMKPLLHLMSKMNCRCAGH